MYEILNEYVKILFECWKWDIWFYSQWWTYACLLIPAMAYLPFFFLKWAMLTAPIWLPINLAFQSIRFKVGGKSK